MGKALLRLSVLPALALTALVAAAGAWAQEPAPAAPSPPLSPCEAKRLAATLPGGVVPDPVDEAPGPVVTAIEIRSVAGLEGKELQEIEALLAVAVGEPLSDSAVRRTLRNLQATGTIAETELYTEEVPGGVEVTVVLAPAYRVRRIEITGDLGLSLEELSAAIPQKEAQPLLEERLVRGVFELQDLYQANGYLEARVRLEPRLDEATREAFVTYQVDSGPRAVVGTITFTGPIAPFSPQQLLERLRVKPGQPYQQNSSEVDTFRLRRFLLNEGYRSARVERPVATPREGREVVDLSFRVETGPRLKLTVVGGEARELEKRNLLPFLGDQGYDDALLLQAVSRIETWYQSQGYYHVRVTQESSATPDSLEIVFTIEPGSRYFLESIEFAGNDTVPAKQLQELMATAPRSLLSSLSAGNGRLVREVLEADLRNIRSYYARLGFSKAKVESRVREEGESLHLALTLEEGPQQRVATFNLDEVCSLDVRKLRQGLAATQPPGIYEGGYFHPVILDETLAYVRAAYEAAGYGDAQVSARTQWHSDTLVDVTLVVLEGPRQVVDRVIVRGNQVTDGDVIRRVARIKTGDPISLTRLRQVERDISRLGLFSRVDVETTRVDFSSPERDVVIRVEEGSQHSLNYGVGYDTDDGARGLLGYSYRNLWGRAVTFRSDLRLSQRNQRFRLLLDQPTLGSWPISLTSTLFYLDADDKNRRIRRWGVRSEAAELRERSTGTIRYSFAYDYRVLELLSIDPGVALNDFERRKSRPYQISSIVPGIFVDRRDDVLDPHRGSTTLAQLQYSFPALGADADFLKVSLQRTEYIDLRRPGVLALSLRVGGIEPFRTLPGKDPDLPADLPSSNIFIDERFFAGGETTHRAYGRDELALLGQSRILSPETGGLVLVGGNGLLLFNADYRFPLFGPVGGVVFFDTGNVWADWRTLDLSEVKSGAGVGVRYLSPIGPLRLEIAWKLDRERDESPYRVLFSFGNPF